MNRKRLDAEIARFEAKLQSPTRKIGKTERPRTDWEERAIRRHLESLRWTRKHYFQVQVRIWLSAKIHRLANWIWYSCSEIGNDET